jgi:hypothetical protein
MKLLAAAQLPCCVITGYHRSGTSLIASLLQSAGLDIGSNLLPGNDTNKNGHFEDMEILGFHEQVLASQGFGPHGFLHEQAVHVPRRLRTAARVLVQARMNGARPWGWKDPRTVLFLDFWRKLVPHLKFVLLFRHPGEVLDSLFRRGDAVFQADPSRALHSWMHYNSAMLRFANRFPTSCLLVETRAVVDDPELLIEAIYDHFGFHLDRPANLYEKDLLHHEIPPHQKNLLYRAFPQVLNLYEQLREQATLALRPDSVADEPALADDEARWALKYWFDYRSVEQKTKETEELLRAELVQLRQELAHTRAPFSVRLYQKVRDWWTLRKG